MAAEQGRGTDHSQPGARLELADSRLAGVKGSPVFSSLLWCPGRRRPMSPRIGVAPLRVELPSEKPVDRFLATSCRPTSSSTSSSGVSLTVLVEDDWLRDRPGP